MDVVHPKCAGLDVHQKTVVACVRLMAGKTVQYHLDTFGTTTGDLLALGDWLTRQGVTHVAMESTGVYWKPIWYALDGQFELLLANPLHVRSIPGRKSDINDATWIADLLAHGLVRSSFVPPEPIQELRDRVARRGGTTNRESRAEPRLSRRISPGRVRARAQATLKTSTR